MIRANKIRISVLLFSSFLSIQAFTNCGVSSFSTKMGSQENPLPVPSQDTSSRTEGILEVKIPAERYERLSDSPYFKAADITAYSNFRAYTPQYPLYSDGATKRRWIYLPEGSQIETTDPDQWIFPQGTILYKEFSVDGKKIETRVFEKTSNQTGFAGWRASVYLWLVDQSDANLLKVDNFYSQSVPEMQLYQASRIDTIYKMANLNQCQTCHSSAKDVAQGFSYLQLSDELKPTNVLTLSKKDFFSVPFSNVDKILGTENERAAIGYIQSNCATCHGGSGPGPHNFRHRSSSASLAEEPLYQSIANAPGLVTFGDTGKSKIHVRMSNRTMPKITLFNADSAGLQIITDWINNSIAPKF